MNRWRRRSRLGGGTRIASAEEFNRKWSRRLLGQNAVVLLISDGLDRDVGEGLGAEMSACTSPAASSSGSTAVALRGFQPRRRVRRYCRT